MALLLNILIAVTLMTFTVIVWCVYFFHRKQMEIKKRNVPYLGARLHQTFKLLTGRVNLFDLQLDFYKTVKSKNAPVVALTEISGRSAFVVTDPDLIKRLLVKDADHFVNLRSVNTRRVGKYLSKMLFLLRDEPWKVLRSKMTPAFTTGKIKRMYQLFERSSKQMNTYLKKEIGESKDVDFCKLLSKYGMDVIASCAFGVDSQSWNSSIDGFSTFEEFARKFELKLGVKQILKFATIVLIPKLADLLRLEILDITAQEYFANLIKQVVKHRRQTGERQEDFLQLMLDIQQGVLRTEEENEISSVKLEFDDDYVIANALLFFLAGFDTTQTVLLFTVYSLAREQTCQEKLYREVKSVMEKNGGQLTYDAIFEMPYLDMVIHETMRMYPAAGRIERECTEDYVVEETGFKFNKGELVIFPALGIHYDEQYYPQPEHFIPERFSSEERAKRSPYTFLGFGHGPRSCIGMRFGLLKVKAVIALLVSEFHLDVCSKTTIPMKLANSANAKPANGMWLKATTRKDL